MHHDHSKKRTEGFRRERTHQNKISNGNKISKFPRFFAWCTDSDHLHPQRHSRSGACDAGDAQEPGRPPQTPQTAWAIKSRPHVELNLEITPGIRDFIGFEFPPCRSVGRPALPCFLSRAFAAPIHSVDLVYKLSGGHFLWPLGASN